MYIKQIVLLVGFSVSLNLNTHAQSGSWAGELDVMGSKLPLVFNFSEKGCTIDSPKQMSKGIPSDWTFNPNGDVRVNIPCIGAKYEGTFDGNKITGTFTQAGMNFTLNLSKQAVKRPQTPIAPFPYATEEVSFTCGKYTLNGTLSLPTNYTKDTPVVLMVTGSGLQNRDEEIMEHKPFAVIADALARQGIASFRYDDCCYGDASFNGAAYTIHDHAKDVECGLALLRKRFNNVGIVGHSEGGTIALMLAAEGKVDFVVSLAGMALSGSETLKKQNEAILLANGMTADEADKALDKAYSCIKNGESIDESIYQMFPETMRSQMKTAVLQLSTPYMKDLLSTDVRLSLSKVKCPVLALNGTKDVQVDCQPNLEALDKGLTQSKHKVVAFDGLNHMFQHCTTGLPYEYYDIEETISPEVVTTIIEWIKK